MSCTGNYLQCFYFEWWNRNDLKLTKSYQNMLNKHRLLKVWSHWFFIVTKIYYWKNLVTVIHILLKVSVKALNLKKKRMYQNYNENWSKSYYFLNTILLGWMAWPLAAMIMSSKANKRRQPILRLLPEVTETKTASPLQWEMVERNEEARQVQ